MFNIVINVTETPLTEPFLIFQSLKSLSSIVESCLLKPINVNAAPEHGDILALLPQYVLCRILSLRAMHLNVNAMQSHNVYFSQSNHPRGHPSAGRHMCRVRSFTFVDQLPFNTRVFLVGTGTRLSDVGYPTSVSESKCDGTDYDPRLFYCLEFGHTTAGS